MDNYIGYKIYKDNLNRVLYAEIANWCNETQEAMIVDEGGYYEVIAIPEPTEKELLEQEKIELETWLKEHDYIGTKIATGRATIEEYADVIAEMTEKANRINEIDELLK